MNVRVRFAPSPTGYLHVGGARTALFNWLFARHHGGTFILRIEDTDRERSTEAAVDAILNGLRYLGIDWDEGPEVGGDFGPYYQSERLDIYEGYVNHLVEQGRAYRCYCTKAELAAGREEALERGGAIKYDRHCMGLSDAERQKYDTEGRSYVIRFRSEDGGETVVDDMIRGTVRFDNEQMDDFIIIKSDGMPTYNFANVIDDSLMYLSHIVRGEEHLSNTPKQLQIYKALDLAPPRFAHIPLILAEDRSKLSKRHAAVAVQDYERDGYLPEAMVNYLALLGWSFNDKDELFSVDQLIEHFTFDKVSKNPAVFDLKKLEWMNGHYIRELDDKELARRALPRLVAADLVPEQVSNSMMDKLTRVMAVMKPRLKRLDEVVSSTSYFFADQIEYDDKAVKKWLSKDYVPRLYKMILDRLVKVNEWSEQEMKSLFHEVQDELDQGMGKIMQPIRLAVTGGTVSPGIFETLQLIGRARSLERIKKAAEMASQYQAD